MTLDSRRTLAAALDYAEGLGWPLLPVEAGGKRPASDVLQAVYGSPGWAPLAARAATAAEIREWFATEPRLNLGLITGMASGVAVLDIDRPELPELPETPLVRTARGHHVYFRASGPTASARLDHADLKSNGGYVLLPLSVHPTGATYRWLMSPAVTPLADLPESIVPPN